MHNIRKSIRLRHHDYSSAGAYFITICVKDRVPILGCVTENGMRLSDIGHIADGRWREIPNRFRRATLDHFVVMPDHIHGIVVLGEQTSTQQEHNGGLRNVAPHSISTIVQSFKANVTRGCKSTGANSFKWQRNYYEHIIHGDNELHQVRTYIQNNPAQWWIKYTATGTIVGAAMAQTNDMDLH